MRSDANISKGIRYPTYDGPIYDVSTNDIICNGGLNPLVTPYDTTIIPVPAGATVTAEFHHTLTSGPSDPEDPIAKGHNGPIMVYLAKVDSALQTSVTGLKWFKIYEDGLTSDGRWAVERLIDNKGKVNFKIPTCIPNGDYFMRVELIALHGAGSSKGLMASPGAQFYMECAQIRISGGGSANPPTVNFPGAYGQSDPGILINIYYPPIQLRHPLHRLPHAAVPARALLDRVHLLRLRLPRVDRSLRLAPVVRALLPPVVRAPLPPVLNPEERLSTDNAVVKTGRDLQLAPKELASIRMIGIVNASPKWPDDTYSGCHITTLQVAENNDSVLSSDQYQIVT
ncbi:hypothetical protein FRC17_004665 [Serendipita sp. 399]|nr:hypothetical protein FRC17_004665 [Serendipita sp. 399]